VLKKELLYDASTCSGTAEIKEEGLKSISTHEFCSNKTVNTLLAGASFEGADNMATAKGSRQSTGIVAEQLREKDCRIANLEQECYSYETVDSLVAGTENAKLHAAGNSWGRLQPHAFDVGASKKDALNDASTSAGTAEIKEDDLKSMSTFSGGVNKGASTIQGIPLMQDPCYSYKTVDAVFAGTEHTKLHAASSSWGRWQPQTSHTGATKEVLYEADALKKDMLYDTSTCSGTAEIKEDDLKSISTFSVLASSVATKDDHTKSAGSAGVIAAEAAEGEAQSARAYSAGIHVAQDEPLSYKTVSALLSGTAAMSQKHHVHKAKAPTSKAKEEDGKRASTAGSDDDGDADDREDRNLARGTVSPPRWVLAMERLAEKGTQSGVRQELESPHRGAEIFWGSRDI